MRRSFNLPAFEAAALTEPKVLVRVILGLLFAANLVAAAFAFHWFDTSPDSVNQQLLAAQSTELSEQARLLKTRALASHIAHGKTEGETFLTSSMTTRRRAYSTIIGEITDVAKAAGMKNGGGTIALEAVTGSEDLDLMSVSFNLEGGYPELLKFMNLLDRSSRFLIIETLTVTPRAQAGTLAVNVKIDTFVREDEAHPPADSGTPKAGAM